MGMNGTLWSQGGEGSQRWTLTSKGGVPTDARPRPGHKPVDEEQAITVPGAAPPWTDPSDDSKYHYDNWIVSMRNRTQPHGDIHTGFKHSIAVIMAARAYREGKKLYWDAKNEQILDHPLA